MYRRYERRKTRPVRVGGLVVGGDAPVSVQTMAKTDTRNLEATLDEIRRLTVAGCEIIRLAVPDREAAENLGAIRQGIDIPLVADIHFDYRLALEAVRQGVDKLRLNPGNIGSEERVREVVAAAQDRGVPIRIGVNAGSLEKDLLEKYGRTPRAMAESALRHIGILEDLHFYDIIVSLKASDVPTMMAAYRLLSDQVEYPLHLGVTEAGPGLQATVKSSVGIGGLLAEGIGDTIRVSLTGDAAEEVKIGREILFSLGLRQRSLEIISCPTCGRIQIDLPKVVQEVEKRLGHIEDPVKVAIMGCVVNGPGEASEADIGLAGGKGVGMLYRRGQQVRRVDEADMVDALVEEVEAFLAERDGGSREASG